MSKPSTNSRKRRWRDRRMTQNPHCYWCGEELIEASNDPQHNSATIDHVYSRLHPHRISGGRGKWVLACYWCNRERNILDHKRFKPETKENDCAN